MYRPTRFKKFTNFIAITLKCVINFNVQKRYFQFACIQVFLHNGNPYYIFFIHNKLVVSFNVLNQIIFINVPVPCEYACKNITACLLYVLNNIKININ